MRNRNAVTSSEVQQLTTYSLRNDHRNESTRLTTSEEKPTVVTSSTKLIVTVTVTSLWESAH